MSHPAQDKLLGRIAVHAKLITMDQLQAATRQQGIEGGRLGEVLIEKGFLTPRQLQKVLAAQKQVLAKHAAQSAAQKAVAVNAPAIEPEPDGAPPEAAPRKAAKAQPRAAASESVPAATAGTALESMHQILRDAVAAGASDVHVHSAAAMKRRCNGVLETIGDDVVAPEQAEPMLRALLSDEQEGRLDAEGELDFAYTLPGAGRFRANVYRQQRGMDGVFRAIPDHPPTLEELSLPSSLAKLTNFHQGMVLVTGPAGCGKSSTMASFIDIVNSERTDHILTIEDPIEYVHPSKRCLVNQRQVRTHTETFGRALRAALREDPDVIAIGELRDLETISLAMTAAETGHFVLATLHTNSTIRTIDRLIGVFPPDQQNQVRTMLSESIRAVISQRLLPLADGSGRVPALEVLHVNRPVGNLIREEKTFQIRSILQTGSAQGMCLLDDSLLALVKDGTISAKEAKRNCEDPKRFENLKD